MSEFSKKKGVLAVVLFMMMLVALPAISWYYLKKGAEFRKQSLSELQDLGQMKWKAVESMKRYPVTSDTLTSKVVLYGIYDATDSSQVKLMRTQTEGLFKQFGKNPSIWIIVNSFRDSSQNAYVDTSGFSGIIPENNSRRLHELPTVDALEQTGIQISANLTVDTPSWILVNDEGVIVNQYNALEKESMKKLVRHTAIVMPASSRRSDGL